MAENARPPNKNAAPSDYAGDLVESVGGSSLGGFRWPGLFQGSRGEEYLQWAANPNGTPQYSPLNWAGIDCSGITNVTQAYAKYDPEIRDWITPRYYDLPFTRANGSLDSSLKDVTVKRIAKFSFPQETDENKAWAYLVSARKSTPFKHPSKPSLSFAVPKTRASKWKYLHRGDIVIKAGHVATAYSDHTGGGIYNFMIIHSSGSHTYKDPASGYQWKFGRKVIVSKANMRKGGSGRGGFNPRALWREILW